MTESPQNPEQLDPEYDHHGGFPEYGVASPGPSFGRFVAAMRRLQDLAVSADPSDDLWNEAAGHAEALAALLAPFRAPEGQAPAGRSPQLPGLGSLLLPPWTMTQIRCRRGGDARPLQPVPCRRQLRGARRRAAAAVRSRLRDGGARRGPADQPTGFLHVDYRKITPTDKPLLVRGHGAATEGRKAFVRGELLDGETLLAEANGLMIRLLPGQP